MNIIAVVTPLSIYHGCSTWKTFWEGKFTLINMKHFGRCNVQKHRDIKDGEKCTTLEISFDFVSMDKMKITSSEPKDYFEISGKGLITFLGIKTIIRSKGEKSQSMPLLMSFWRIFLILLRNLRGCLMKFMFRRCPNMNLLTVTFIQQYRFLSVWWDSIRTLAL